MTEIVADSRWLVLGDSLSDGLWARDPAGIGSAWPSAALRLASEAGRPILVRNRAQGGARSVDVLAMLRQDPEVARDHRVAVLVGANDLWRRWVPWEGQASVDPDDFARALRQIVALCRDHGSRSIALMTPCVLHADPDHAWNSALEEYRDAVVRVAKQEETILVPTGEEFLAAMRIHPEVKWTYDGVHPRPVGHERLARTWLHHACGLPDLPMASLPPKPSGFRLGRWP